jgi:hypothetical protein
VINIPIKNPKAKNLTASISSLSMTGVLVIVFSESINIPSIDLSYFGDSVLNLTIIPGYISDESRLKFNWTCSEFTNTTMTIKISF